MNQTKVKTHVRPMLRPELDKALDWAAAEGWNPGLFDAEAFFCADPKGFFVADCGGKPVGAISAITYGDGFGFIGLFIVLPEFRGGSCGKELARRALKYLGERAIGVDGVIDKQSCYRRLGFEPAYKTIRYRGVSPQAASETNGSELRLIDLRRLPLRSVNGIDSTLFPAPREGFLLSWIRQPGHTGLGVIQQEKLAGFGVVRPCRTGYKIGPLFARNVEAAHKLFEGLLVAVPDAEVFIDVPEPNEAALKMVQEQGWQPVFETARMYRGDVSQPDLSQIFGVTTLELG